MSCHTTDEPSFLKHLIEKYVVQRIYSLQDGHWIVTSSKVTDWHWIVTYSKFTHHSFDFPSLPHPCCNHPQYPLWNYEHWTFSLTFAPYHHRIGPFLNESVTLFWVVATVTVYIPYRIRCFPWLIVRKEPAPVLLEQSEERPVLDCYGNKGVNLEFPVTLECRYLWSYSLMGTPSSRTSPLFGS